MSFVDAPDTRAAWVQMLRNRSEQLERRSRSNRMQITICGQESNDALAEKVAELDRWALGWAPAIRLSVPTVDRVRLLATVLEHARESARKHGESVVLSFLVRDGRLVCEASAYGAVR